MKFREGIVWVVVAVLALILLQRECTRPSSDIIVKTETDTIYQDTGSHTISYVPRDNIIYRPSLPQVDSFLDTIETPWPYIADYLTVRQYDTTLEQSDVVLSITDTVSRNRLTGRRLSIANVRPTLTITNTTTVSKDPRWSFWVGGHVRGSNVAGGHLRIEARKWSVMGGYDLDQQWFAGIDFPIIKHRPK